MSSVSVVIPVKDAGPLLERVLAAVRAQGDLELLVIDSGSRDGSREIARAAGADVDRDSARGVRPWAHAQPRRRARVGRPASLPHAGRRADGGLARRPPRGVQPLGPSGSRVRPPPPLRGHEPDDRAGAHGVLRRLLARRQCQRSTGAGDPAFLSNVNACYARACWEEIRFADVAYAEDQAFGRAMLEAGWAKVYHPRRGCPPRARLRAVEFVKRYFDEYRGLREASGHVEPLRPLDAAREVARDARWLRAQGLFRDRRARWLARSAGHHSGRRVASAARLACGAVACRRAAGTVARGTGARPGPAACRPDSRCLPRLGPGLMRRSCASAVRVRCRLLTPVARHGRPRAAPRGGRDPAIPARKRRPQHDLHADRRARGHGPHLHDLDVRPERAPPRGGRRAARADRGGVRARCGLRCSRASTTGTAPTWRWQPAGTRPTGGASARTAARAPT